MSHFSASVRRVALAGNIVFGAMAVAQGLFSAGRNCVDPSYWQVVFGFFAIWMVLGTLAVRLHPRPPSLVELLQCGAGGAWLSLIIWGSLGVVAGLLSVWHGWNLLGEPSFWYGMAQMYLLSTGMLTLVLWAAPFKGRWDEDNVAKRNASSNGGA